MKQKYNLINDSTTSNPFLVTIQKYPYKTKLTSTIYFLNQSGYMALNFVKTINKLKIQVFQSKILKLITNNTLHSDLHISKVTNSAKQHYFKFRNCLQNHINSLVQNPYIHSWKPEGFSANGPLINSINF